MARQAQSQDQEEKGPARTSATVWPTSSRPSTTRSSPSPTAPGASVCWTSAGTVGFKGARKGTPVRRPAGRQGSRRSRPATSASATWTSGSRAPGPAANRPSAPCSRGGLEIKSIKDVTPIPHNGCRVCRRRRV